MTKKIKYNCKENDNRIHLLTEYDDESIIDEIHVGSSLLSEGMTVIGMKDLKEAFKMAGLKIVKLK